VLIPTETLFSNFFENKEGSSANPCSDVYNGGKAFSEPEAGGVAAFMTAVAKVKKFLIAISIHSYSQFWMWSWAYTGQEFPFNVAKTEQGAKIAVDALQNEFGTEYQAGPTSKLITYKVTGSSSDWMCGENISKLTYALELRDTGELGKLGEYGFLLPCDQIIPSGIETFAAIKALADFALKNQKDIGKCNKNPKK